MPDYKVWGPPEWFVDEQAALDVIAESDSEAAEQWARHHDIGASQWHQIALGRRGVVRVEDRSGMVSYHLVSGRFERAYTSEPVHRHYTPAEVARMRRGEGESK